MVNLSLRKKPKIENPDIAKIKASFKYNYKAVKCGYENARFLDVDEFLTFASMHEVEEVCYRNYYGNYTEFFYTENGLVYSITIPTEVNQ